MLSAKEAMIKLREVRKVEKEKSERELQEMVEKELANIEKEIEIAIANSQSELNYIFQNRSHIIHMRSIMNLEAMGYIITFIEKASSINISWNIEFDTL